MLRRMKMMLMKFMMNLLLPHLPATPPPSPQQEHITSQPQATTAPLSPPPQQQPSYDAEISKTLLTTLLETCVDEDVILEEVDAKIIKDVDVQGRLEESQAKTEVATTANTTITAASTTITAASVPKASAPRKRGVIIQDPEEAATASLSVQSEVKSKDKGKGILVEEPKPLKKQA
nr:hypothetical protein [Tanacetum cinerariifolium]